MATEGAAGGAESLAGRLRSGGVGFWIAVVLGAAWCWAYLAHPLWPEETLPADASQNGPRWYLLLVPDQILDGWLSGPVTLGGLAVRALVLVPALVVLAVAWVAGRWLLRACPPLPSLGRGEAVVLAVLAGLSLESLVTLSVGLAGGVGRLGSGPLIAVFTLAIAWSMAWSMAWAMAWALRRSGGADCGPEAGADEPESSVSFESGTGERVGLRLLQIVVVGLGALVVLRALMPPAEYDVREYHLQAPKEWSEAGRIDFMPHNIYANMPMGAELHVLTAIDWTRMAGVQPAWWWGALAGKVVLASFALLTAAGCGLVVSRWTNRLAGWATAALALTFPALVEGATLGLIEAAVAAFFSAALVVFSGVVWEARGNPGGSVGRAWGWIGFFVGSACACKYPALGLIAAPLGLVALTFPAGSGATGSHLRLRRVGWFTLLLLVACGPWFAKNAVLAGNPVYPLAGSFFGGRTLTPEKIEQWDRGHARQPISIASAGETLRRLGWGWRTQGLLLVPLAAVGLVAARRMTITVWLVVLAALAFLVWWGLSHRVPRFLIPVFPAVLVLGGLGWEAIRQRLHGKLALGLLGFGIALNGIMIAGPLLGDSRLLVELSHLRADEPQVERTTRLPPQVYWVNTNLPQDARLLLVGDAAAFDYELAVDYATTFDRSPLVDVVSNGEPAGWPAEFKRARWTHVLVDWKEIARLRGSYGFDETITRDLFERLVAVGVLQRVDDVDWGERATLYRVTVD